MPNSTGILSDVEKKLALKIDDFFKQFKEFSCKKGEIFISPYDQIKHIFFLTKGIAREYAVTKKGSEITLNLYKPKSFFPMACAINNVSNYYYYVAEHDCVFRKVPKEEVLKFLEDNSDVLMNLLSRVYSGVEGVRLRMLYGMTGTILERLLCEILIMVERFGVPSGENSYTFRSTQSSLAAAVGSSRESVNREIHLLKEKKLISFYAGVFYVHDKKKLEDELYK